MYFWHHSFLYRVVCSISIGTLHKSSAFLSSNVHWNAPYLDGVFEVLGFVARLEAVVVDGLVLLVEFVFAL